MRRLTFDPAAELLPVWSPNATKLASDREVECDADGNCNAEILVMRADGTSVTRLTSDLAQDAFADWQLEERRKR